MAAGVVACVLVVCSSAQAIGARNTTVTVSCEPGSVAVSQPTKCTATVADTEAGTPSTPTETVSFSSSGEGKFSSPGCPLTEVAGPEHAARCSVEYTPSATGGGTASIVAKYGGDVEHEKSEGTTTLSVTARATAVLVSCGSGVVVSQPATCTARVTDTETAGTPSTPEGTVRFKSDVTAASFGLEGACTLTPLASGSSSACSLEYKPGEVGSGVHTIRAEYGGDATHAEINGSGTLPVSAPAPPAPPVVTTTPATVATVASVTATSTPVATPVASPRPTCRVVAKQRWSSVTRRKRPHRVEVPTLLVTYTCDQTATVRIGGTVTIAATRRRGKVKKARTIDLRPVSSTAAAGRAQPAVLALPASAATALRSAVRTGVVVTFKVSNANGSGAATIRFLLTPPPHTTS
jgi:hypothetical protein